MSQNGPDATGSMPPPRRRAHAEGVFSLVSLLVGVALPGMAGVWYWIVPVAFRRHGIDGHAILFVLMCGVFTTLATLLSVGAGRTGARTHSPSEMTT